MTTQSITFTVNGFPYTAQDAGFKESGKNVYDILDGDGEWVANAAVHPKRPVNAQLIQAVLDNNE